MVGNVTRNKNEALIVLQSSCLLVLLHRAVVSGPLEKTTNCVTGTKCGNGKIINAGVYEKIEHCMRCTFYQICAQTHDEFFKKAKFAAVAV